MQNLLSSKTEENVFTKSSKKRNKPPYAEDDSRATVGLKQIWYRFEFQ